MFRFRGLKIEGRSELYLLGVHSSIKSGCAPLSKEQKYFLIPLLCVCVSVVIPFRVCWLSLMRRPLMYCDVSTGASVVCSPVPRRGVYTVRSERAGPGSGLLFQAE